MTDALAPHVAVTAVVVSRSAFEDGHADTLPRAVGKFVDALLCAEYMIDELPREAVIAHYLWLYEGEVANGGHATTIANLGSDPSFWTFVPTGLAMFGLDAFAAIFADLEAFRRRHPSRYKRCSGEYREIDSYYWQLDDRYGALAPTAISQALTPWLKSRPWVSVVADDTYRNMIGRLVIDHPLRDLRRAKRSGAVEREFAGLVEAFRRRMGWARRRP